MRKTIECNTTVDPVEGMSESDRPIVIEFENGLVVDGVLDRVKGPLIVEEIMHRLPIIGRAVVMGSEMRITLGIGRGNLKAARDLKRGEIAYMPLGDSLCIYLDDTRSPTPVNPLGRVISDHLLDTLRDVRRGARVTIRPG